MRTARRLLCVFVCLACFASAQTIILKNGRKIVTDSVREENDRVFYEIGEGSYAIPKSSIDRIERSATTPASAPVPAFIPNTAAPSFANADVIKEHRVDDEAIGYAERSGDAALAAGANYQAGRFSLEQGDRDSAARYFDRALRFEPDNPGVLINYAAILVQVGRPQDAVPLAEKATRVAPESADAWAVLGYALTQSDHAKEAIPAFERSMKIRPDENVNEFLRRARAENNVESGFQAGESGHFTMRFEGGSARASTAKAILQQLESGYDDLTRELGTSPRGSIPVILYTQQALFDITQAPSWSGAINDGKLRIPVSGVTEVTPQLARILRHELTHSFVVQITRGRCPMWLNEGVAQIMEPRTLDSNGPTLAILFKNNQQTELNSLETTFLNLSNNEAAVAYAESLAAVEYIQETYGMSDIRRLLERIGEGSSTETALRATFNVGYGQFQQDIGTYLQTRYAP